MAFSQSFSFGENTLNQLDVCEVNIHRVGTSVNKTKSITPTRKKSQQPLNGISISNGFANMSPVSDAINSNKILDVVDESPTEKTNVLGKSIRERLKNASTSKKTERKHIRRSRSDPISASDSKISKSSMYKPSFTEEFGSMFDSTMELDEPDERANKKTKIKLDEKFLEDDDDFDKFFGDIQTPAMQNDAQGGNDTKSTNSLIALSDSGESDQVNVSDIERLMHTENFDQTADSVVALVKKDESQNELEWEDSAFFNDLLASQQNGENSEENGKIDPKRNDSHKDVVIDADCVSMPCGQNEDIRAMEKDLENCFLEVSIHLSNLNSTEAKSIHRTGSQFETSMVSRSISDRVVSSGTDTKTDLTNNLSIIRPNKLCIDNLADWSCSASIIKAYKKKGINEMFEWQAECLNNPKVSKKMTYFFLVVGH